MRLPIIISQILFLLFLGCSSAPTGTHPTPSDDGEEKSTPASDDYDTPPRDDIDIPIIFGETTIETANNAEADRGDSLGDFSPASDSQPMSIPIMHLLHPYRGIHSFVEDGADLKFIQRFPIDNGIGKSLYTSASALTLLINNVTKYDIQTLNNETHILPKIGSTLLLVSNDSNLTLYHQQFLQGQILADMRNEIALITVNRDDNTQTAYIQTSTITKDTKTDQEIIVLQNSTNIDPNFVYAEFHDNYLIVAYIQPNQNLESFGTRLKVWDFSSSPNLSNLHDIFITNKILIGKYLATYDHFLTLLTNDNANNIELLRIDFNNTSDIQSKTINISTSDINNKKVKLFDTLATFVIDNKNIEMVITSTTSLWSESIKLRKSLKEILYLQNEIITVEQDNNHSLLIESFSFQNDYQRINKKALDFTIEQSELKKLSSAKLFYLDDSASLWLEFTSHNLDVPVFEYWTVNNILSTPETYGPIYSSETLSKPQEYNGKLYATSYEQLLLIDLYQIENEIIIPQQMYTLAKNITHTFASETIAFQIAEKPTYNRQKLISISLVEKENIEDFNHAKTSYENILLNDPHYIFSNDTLIVVDAIEAKQTTTLFSIDSNISSDNLSSKTVTLPFYTHTKDSDYHPANKMSGFYNHGGEILLLNNQILIFHPYIDTFIIQKCFQNKSNDNECKKKENINRIVIVPIEKIEDPLAYITYLLPAERTFNFTVRDNSLWFQTIHEIAESSEQPIAQYFLHEWKLLQTENSFSFTKKQPINIPGIFLWRENNIIATIDLQWKSFNKQHLSFNYLEENGNNAKLKVFHDLGMSITSCLPDSNFSTAYLSSYSIDDTTFQKVPISEDLLSVSKEIFSHIYSIDITDTSTVAIKEITTIRHLGFVTDTLPNGILFHDQSAHTSFIISNFSSMPEITSYSTTLQIDTPTIINSTVLLSLGKYGIKRIDNNFDYIP